MQYGYHFLDNLIREGAVIVATSGAGANLADVDRGNGRGML
jgi:hypothetical protein